MSRASRAALVGACVLGGCVTSTPAPMYQGDQPLIQDESWMTRLPKGAVTGRVIDGSTGLGLAGVKIQVLNVEPPASATTDETGAFVLPVVVQGKQIVVAEKAGFTAPPGALIADVMPNTTITMGAFAMHPVAVSPSPTPRQWLRARFSKARGVNADASAFDSERHGGEGELPVSGGVVAAWHDQSDHSDRGEAPARVFVVEAWWLVGMAPPWAKVRAIELRFAAPPAAGQRLALSAGAVSHVSAQLRYVQGYRFREDRWAATGGTLLVTPAEGGTVKLVFTGATMAPDPQGADSQSQAAGTFVLTGEGVVLPQDQRAQPAPASPTTTPRPGKPNLNGIWTFGLPDGTQTPIPACGATYRQFVFEDPDLDGHDVTIRVRDVVPPGSGAPAAVSWLLMGGLVDDHYEFQGEVPGTGADGQPSTKPEHFRLTYDAATGRLVGNRQVGPSVAEGGRGALPVELVRALFEAPPPEGCPSPSAPPGERESP